MQAGTLVHVVNLFTKARAATLALREHAVPPTFSDRSCKLVAITTSCPRPEMGRGRLHSGDRALATPDVLLDDGPLPQRAVFLCLESCSPPLPMLRLPFPTKAALSTAPGGFGRCRLVFAVPDESPVLSLDHLGHASPLFSRISPRRSVSVMKSTSK